MASEATDNDANPLEQAVAADARATRGGRYGWVSLVIAAFFGLFYAYSLWQAVSTLVALPAFYDAFGYGAANVPWALLWIGVAIPVIVFLAAFAIGRRHNPGARALIFLVGLTVVAGLSLGINGLEDVLRPTIGFQST